jgi:hypothetical protein
MEFELVIGFIEHILIITTSKYDSVANAHTLQFTRACIKYFRSTMSSAMSSASMLIFLLAGNYDAYSYSADCHLKTQQKDS